MNLKEDAEFYRLALEMELCEIPEVIAWCDEVILTYDVPDIAVIEASLMGRNRKIELLGKLSEVQGEFGWRQILARILERNYQIVSEDRQQAFPIARQLNHIHQGYYPPLQPLGPEMENFWFELGKEEAYEDLYGSTGKFDALVDTFIDYLKTHSSAEK